MRELLVRALDLQMLAFDNGLNMYVWTRDTQSDGEPWFTGRVYVEGSAFDAETKGVTQQTFEIYHWREVESNVEELDKIEEFINNYKK